MTKILLAEDSRSIREAIADVLGAEGYEIIEAPNGRIALQKATEESPDLVLMDLLMPDMGGLEALRHIREIPHTESLPVIIMTSVPPYQGEPEATLWGAAHYIAKPFELETLKAAVRSTLREAKLSKNQSAPISTRGRLRPLEKLLKGGITRGTLTLIEGETFSGKSTLCQHFVYGALSHCCGVGYFASDHTIESLSARMGSLGMAVGAAISSGKLVINALPRITSEMDSSDVIALLTEDIGRLPNRCKLVVVDSITELLQLGREPTVLTVLQALKRMCQDDKTVLLTADAAIMTGSVGQKLQDVSENYIGLSNQRNGEKLLKNLTVLKASGSVLTGENSLSFQVQKDLGIRIQNPATAPALALR